MIGKSARGIELSGFANVHPSSINIPHPTAARGDQAVSKNKSIQSSRRGAV